MKIQNKGFTLIEIVVVIVVLGILAGLVLTNVVPRWRERAYYTRSLAELNTMGSAFKLYLVKYNEYPPDEARNIPSGIKEFVQGQADTDDWPDAPFPGSVYDYDNWPAGVNGDQTYQVSLRFCNAGEDAICKARAQKYLSDYVSASVLAGWDSRSSMYYCIKGSCRSHNDVPTTHPGFCVNCGGKTGIN